MKKVFVCCICCAVAFTGMFCLKNNGLKVEAQDSNVLSDQEIISDDLSGKDSSSENLKVQNLSSPTLVNQEENQEEIDADISQMYDSIADSYIKKYEKRNVKIDKDKVNKNKDILKELHTKAKRTSQKGVIVEEKNSSFEDGKVIKTYLKDGNSRKETFLNGNSEGFTLYNFEKDCMYVYDEEKNEVLKSVDYSLEHNGYRLYQDGLFEPSSLSGQIMCLGNAKEMCIDGKEMVYLQVKLGIVNYEYYVDKETGFVLNSVKTNTGTENAGQTIATFNIELETDIDKTLFEFNKAAKVGQWG